MTMIVLLIVLGIGTVIVVGIGERLALPWPALMVFLGTAVALIPGLEKVEIDSELILPIFLPPLLYATAQRTSWMLFRSTWKFILFLAVGLVAATVAVVSATALWLIPGITLTSAIALGAMVAPPDPVAVEAVSASAPLPRKIQQVFQSEGLFNDAAALVIFQLAVAATVEGHSLDFGWLAVKFLLAAVLAVIVGFVMAQLVRWLMKFSHNTVARSTAQLVMPFAVYLVAEHVGGSGVIAVVVAALEMRRQDVAERAEERVMQEATWSVLEMLITGVAFGLIGVELRITIMNSTVNLWEAVLGGLIIAAAMVVLRFLWLAVVMLLVDRKAQRQFGVKNYLKGVTVMTWGGMRGLATLALALSLPLHTRSGAEFPGHDSMLMVVVVALGVTLLAAGLSFPSAVKKLSVVAKNEHKQEAMIAARARRASLNALKHADDVPEEIREELRARLRTLQSQLAGSDEGAEREESLKKIQKNNALFSKYQGQSLKAARAEVLRCRGERGIDPEAADQVLRRLDLQTVLLEGRDDMGMRVRAVTRPVRRVAPQPDSRQRVDVSSQEARGASDGGAADQSAAGTGRSGDNESGNAAADASAAHADDSTVSRG